MITAPYNFVPLSDKVVSPYWAKLVSHDIPFKDSQSGVLDLTIKAESPIYVRNGVAKNATDSEKNAFNKFGSEYFIPGSSIKGMLRSVMEIMSFGRMGNKVNDHKYSVRDFQNPNVYPIETFSNNIQCGFLKINNGKYYLKDCGKPGRIDQASLSANFHKVFNSANKFDRISNPSGWNSNSDYHKSAKYKYDNFSAFLTTSNFDLDFIDHGKEVYKVGTSKRGVIVFTGQPAFNDCKIVNGKKRCGKHYEFVFFDTKNNFEILSDDENYHDKLIDNLFFAYHDHETSDQKEDWKRIKPMLESGIEIPVFFRKENGIIIDMGLSFLYKITYKNSIKDAIEVQQKNAISFDLAETIFGYAEDKNSLKGRVHIGHAFVKNQVTPLQEKSEVLAGPKASYYPNYIEQNPNAEGKVGKYKTLMEDNARIRGWKRYPVRGDNNPVTKSGGTGNVYSKFIPLPSGTTFSFQVHYHNLRKEELGALISAVTFHNTAGLFHSIGSGKPLGYGKVSVLINNISEDVKLQMLKAYEIFMDYSLNNSTPLWFQLPQIKELFAMAKPGVDDDQLKYMQLPDFVSAKGKRRTDPLFALKKYSAIVNNIIDVTALSSEDELKEAKVNYDKEKALFEAQQDIDTLKQSIIEKKELDLENALNEKKKEWLSSLNLRRQAMANKEQQEKIETENKERLEKAASGLPPEWNNINDFGNLANRIPAWQKKLPDQVIPEAFQNDLANLFKKIIQYELTLNKKKKDWDGSFESNKNFKRITGWIGESKARALYEEINMIN